MDACLGRITRMVRVTVIGSSIRVTVTVIIRVTVIKTTRMACGCVDACLGSITRMACGCVDACLGEITRMACGCVDA